MDKNKYDLNEVWNRSQQKHVDGELTCDPEKYREYLDEFELSEQEEGELLGTLWMIMASFVDMGFGVDSVQFVTNDQPDASTRADEAISSPIGSEIASEFGLQSNEGDLE